MASPWSPAVTVLFAVLLPFYFTALAFHFLMVWKVNRWLPYGQRIPYSFRSRGWNRVAKEYRRLYPRSRLYLLALVCAVVTSVLSLAIFCIRFREYAVKK